MNITVVRALLAQHLLRTWPFVAAGFALGVLFVTPFALQAEYAPLNEIEPASQVIALLVVVLGLLYSAADGERLTCEIPQRTLLLPVRTSVIVATHFLYNTVCVLVLSLSLHGTLAVALSPGYENEWWTYPAAAVLAFVVLQTVALAVGCLGDWSIGILLGVVILIVRFLDLQMSASVFSAMVFLFVLVCLVASCGVVHLRRTGRWEPELLIPRSLRNTRRADQVLPPFKSPFEAQRWFEGRRARPVFLGVYGAIAITIGAFGIVPRIYVQRFYEDYTPLERWLWAAGNYGMTFHYTMFLSGVVAGAVYFIENFRLQTGPMQAFLYLRPMTTSQLAEARIAAAKRIFATGACLTAFFTIGFFTCWLFISRTNPASGALQEWGLAVVVLRVILAVIAGSAFAWVAYWTGNVLLAFVGTVIIGNVMAVSTELSSAERSTVFLIVATAVSVVVGAIAVRKRVLSIAQLGWNLVFAFAVALTVPLVGGWYNNISIPRYPTNYEDLPFFIAVAVILAVPAASVPLIMSWNRHR